MRAFIGYGFSIREISKENWVRLVREYDPDIYKDTHRGLETAGRDFSDTIGARVLEAIDEKTVSRAEYLSDIINREEKKRTGTENITTAAGEYIVFTPLRFAAEEKRAATVPRAIVFVKLIRKYVDTAGIAFGNIFAEVEDETMELGG